MSSIKTGDTPCDRRTLFKTEGTSPKCMPKVHDTNNATIELKMALMRPEMALMTLKMALLHSTI